MKAADESNFAARVESLFARSEKKMGAALPAFAASWNHQAAAEDPGCFLGMLGGGAISHTAGPARRELEPTMATVII